VVDDPADRTVPIAAVTFDAGQTLVELDTELLSARLAERGVVVQAVDLDAALPAAWRRYEQLVAAGAMHPWKQLMGSLLDGALGSSPPERASIIDWLWNEQPRRNLWRRPVPGMIELAGRLAAAGVVVGVISNSEGRLAELFDEIGWHGRFAVIADSGRLGIDKPDSRIFAWTCQQLGVPPAAVVHIGDSRAADVDGAVAAGLRAIWFGPAAQPSRDPRIAVARDAAEVAAALRHWGRAA